MTIIESLALITIAMLLSLAIMAIPLLIIYWILGWFGLPHVWRTVASTAAAFLILLAIGPATIIHGLAAIILCAVILCLGRKRIAQENKQDDADLSIFK